MVLQKISKFFLYTAVFSVVVVLPDTFFPFIGGKYYFFRLMVEASAAFALLWWAFAGGDLDKRLRRLVREPVFLAVSAFVAVFLLASIFAYDSHAAFWSNYERGEGGFQMLHYYVFFALLVLFLRQEEEWRMLFKLSLVAAGVMIVYGLLSAAGAPNFLGPYYQEGLEIAPTFFGRLFHPVARFQGSLGNPAYVAPYLMFAMFYVLWLWFRERGAVYRNWLYGSWLAVILFFFVLTQTRGAFVGLGAGILIFLLYVFWVDPRLRRVAAAGLAALVLLGAVLFFLRNTPLVSKLPVSRIWEINLSDSTFRTRLWTWNSAWQGIKKRPLLGWGPENFSTVFDRYFDPRHYVAPDAQTWFDRAHSVIFDYLAETGVLGFLSYLSVFAVFYLQFFRRRGELTSWLQALVFALPVAYLVQGLILFEVLPLYVNLFVFLAFCAAVVFKGREEAAKGEPPR